MSVCLLIIIYLAFICLGLPDSMLGAAWPIMHEDIGVSLGTAGTITMIVSAGTIVSSFFSSGILKRFGTGPVTFVSILLTAVSLLGISYSNSILWFFILSVPLGFGAGCVDAGLNYYIATYYKSYHMSWLHCFWGVGAMVGPIIISGYIKMGSGWRSGYLTVSILQLLLVFLILLALPLWKQTEKTLQGQDKACVPLDEEVRGLADIKYSDILWFKGVKPSLLAFFMYCAIEVTIGLWGSSYLVETRGIDESTAAGWIALYYTGITLGRFVNGFLTLRYSNKVLIRVGEIVIIIGLLLMLLPLPDYILLCSFVITGLGSAPIYPCMLHETPIRFGKEYASKLMGIQLAVAYSSFTFLPPILGSIFTRSSMNSYPYVAILYSILMLISSERVNSIIKNRSR